MPQTIAWAALLVCDYDEAIAQQLTPRRVTV
jgi:hypothetical protein